MLFEINEVFLVVVLMSMEIVGFLVEKVNVNGGVVVFGYLIGVSGVCIVVMFIYELRWWGGGLGIVFICSGGG